MAQKQRANQAITLKGSTAIVTEFFNYSINSILYQRGVYPSDEFKIVKKYGLPMLMLTNEEVQEYISTILTQVHEWILTSSITRLVLAIKSADTGETAERWQFDLYTDDSALDPLPGGPKATAKGEKKKDKTEKEVQGEIREIIKQITSTVTFLPMPEGEYTFNILAYHDGSSEAIPATWDDADPHLIDQGKVEQVRLRSFSTNVHNLEALVSYRMD
ncbi:hypothetical protein B9479_000138 [Cryptococcus floricola]|uniref:HORMA domain-containing protein n=1 Tax=Cryptococcus floricola TaxID=2591691 RepID=A0A5D3B8Y4_9TREE|nr:hypothetical protein B9479_000138 [Cryptococcus floricola]